MIGVGQHCFQAQRVSTITVTAAQRIQHGRVRVLKDMMGLDVSSLELMGMFQAEETPAQAEFPLTTAGFSHDAPAGQVGAEYIQHHCEPTTTTLTSTTTTAAPTTSTTTLAATTVRSTTLAP